jgi:hypothetical protein
MGGRVDRQDVALNPNFANAPRQQVTVLTTRVENCDAVHEVIIVGRTAVTSR